MINHCRATAHFYCRQAVRDSNGIKTFFYVFRIVFMNTPTRKMDKEDIILRRFLKKSLYPFIPIDLNHLSRVSKVIGISTTNESRF